MRVPESRKTRPAALGHGPAAQRSRAAAWGPVGRWRGVTRGRRACTGGEGRRRGTEAGGDEQGGVASGEEHGRRRCEKRC